MREYSQIELGMQGQPRHAAQEIVRELMNAILSENTFGILDAMAELDAVPISLTIISTFAPSEVRWMYVPLDQALHGLVFAVSTPSLQPYRLASTEVAEMRWVDGTPRLECYLDAPALVEHLSQLTAGRDGLEYPNLAQFLDDLRAAEQQTAVSLRAFQIYLAENTHLFTDFLAAERWSSFRDRPFHPTARVKRGWNLTEYQQYGAEFQRPLTLQWMAIRRDAVLSSSVTNPQTPDAALLAPDDRQQLLIAFDHHNISPSEYLAIPVHPWHMQAVLLPQFQAEIASRTWIPLDVHLGAYVPSSSVRSLAPLSGIGDHVKLPLGIVALGAVRYLPALYLINGQKAQHMLEEAKRIDPVLQKCLQLCDETHWWAYFPTGADFFDDRPRHLSCLIRRYPQPAISQRYAPMSALAVVDPERRLHFFDTLGDTQAGVDAIQALDWFRTICDQFLGAIMRLLRLGIVPEIHGQNVVLVFDHDRVTGILLRDFDTTRLYLPWLSAAGLHDPAYIVKPNRPNSLYNERPEDLLFYIQTLGIQVNLYAIIDALAQRYGIREERGWQVIHESLERSLQQIEFTASQRRLIEDCLFAQPTWPTKLCVTPLLQQQGGAIGSMPSGQGCVRNPLLGLGESTS